jgi:hypothetical protein
MARIIFIRLLLLLPLFLLLLLLLLLLKPEQALVFCWLGWGGAVVNQIAAAAAAGCLR